MDVERTMVGKYGEEYYLQIADGPRQRVSQEEFVSAERAAGFRPKPGCGPVATGGFSSGPIRGSVDFPQTITHSFPEQEAHDWDSQGVSGYEL